MNPARRRTILFILCAIVLLAAGYAWGYSRAYNGFYAPDAVLERETLHFNFNARVLHYTNLAQRAESQRELVTRLRQQSVYITGLLPALSPAARAEARHELQQAERVIAGQPLAGDTPAAVSPVPGTPPTPPDRP